LVKKVHLTSAEKNTKWVEKEYIYKNSDLISLHVPLTRITRDMVRSNEINLMKSDSILINTARGGIINEFDLSQALKAGVIGGAAIDVFEQEPYSGPLIDLSNCLLTSHMGSMSVDCRSRMEVEATEEVIRFFTGNELLNLVPPEEYESQNEAG
jgi:D-3-phosphoglycerate dehydrogenase